MNEEVLVNEIAEDLECFDLVFLIDDKNLAEQFCRSDALAAAEKHIKLYLPCEMRLETPTIICRKISNEEKETILNLYYLYDFSDRFILLSEKSGYGGLFNYTRTGWLTLNEVFSAFLS